MCAIQNQLLKSKDMTYQELFYNVIFQDYQYRSTSGQTFSTSTKFMANIIFSGCMMHELSIDHVKVSELLWMFMLDRAGGIRKITTLTNPTTKSKLLHTKELVC